jgi:hypothetical protein
MNRRSFLSGLFKGAVAVAVAPQIVTHGLHLRKRLIEPARIVIINPEWLDAPYEVRFFHGTDFSQIKDIKTCMFSRIQIMQNDDAFIHDSTPLRFKLGKDGDFEHVTPFKLI